LKIIVENEKLKKEREKFEFAITQKDRFISELEEMIISGNRDNSAKKRKASPLTVETNFQERL
jgi:hypothetical protein